MEKERREKNDGEGRVFIPPAGAGRVLKGPAACMGLFGK